MIEIDLTKPGRQFVYDSGDRYRVYQHPLGCLEIERISDGATAFFQGDDAGGLDDDLSAATDAPLRGTPCDVVCGQYDDILTMPEDSRK